MVTGVESFYELWLIGNGKLSLFIFNQPIYCSVFHLSRVLPSFTQPLRSALRRWLDHFDCRPFGPNWPLRSRLMMLMPVLQLLLCAAGSHSSLPCLTSPSITERDINETIPSQGSIVRVPGSTLVVDCRAVVYIIYQ